jgi:hypothetical protein
MASTLGILTGSVKYIHASNHSDMVMVFVVNNRPLTEIRTTPSLDRMLQRPCCGKDPIY